GLARSRRLGLHRAVGHGRGFGDLDRAAQTVSGGYGGPVLDARTGGGDRRGVAGALRTAERARARRGGLGDRRGRGGDVTRRCRQGRRGAGRGARRGRLDGQATRFDRLSGEALGSAGHRHRRETTVPEGSRRSSPGSGHDFRDNGTEESTSGEYSRPEDGSKEDSDCGGGLIASRESTAGKEPGKPIGGGDDRG